LISTKWRWCSAAGEVIVGMTESNGSLPPGFSHLRADSWGRGSALEPYACFQFRTTFTFITRKTTSLEMKTFGGLLGVGFLLSDTPSDIQPTL